MLTMKEAVQAALDGRPVQFKGESGWETRTMRYVLLAASDAQNPSYPWKDEDCRLGPISPGDLCYEDAVEAVKRGEKVEVYGRETGTRHTSMSSETVDASCVSKTLPFRRGPTGKDDEMTYTIKINGCPFVGELNRPAPAVAVAGTGWSGKQPATRLALATGIDGRDEPLPILGRTNLASWMRRIMDRMGQEDAICANAGGRVNYTRISHIEVTETT